MTLHPALSSSVSGLPKPVSPPPAPEAAVGGGGGRCPGRKLLSGDLALSVPEALDGAWCQSASWCRPPVVRIPYPAPPQVLGGAVWGPDFSSLPLCLSGSSCPPEGKAASL